MQEAAIEARKHKQEENQELAAQIKAEIRDLEEKRKAETEAEVSGNSPLLVDLFNQC